MTRTIGLNLLWLIPGVVGGSEEYTLRLLKAVEPHLGPDLAVELFCQPSLLDAHPDLGDRFHTHTPPVATARKLPRFGIESSWLPIASRHVAAIHHGGGVLPYDPIPQHRRRPSLVTIHDTQPLDLPTNFSSMQRRWFSVMLPRAAKRAELLICTSEFTKQQMIRHFDVPEARLRVVSHGWDAADASHAPVMTPAVSAALAGRRFLFSPGIAHPHKRHVDLVRALPLLSDDHLVVVFTGSPGAESAELRSEAERLGIADRVLHLGRVAESDIAALHAGATAMVMPSEYEGFGIPLLEAMAARTPVIATNAAAVREVVGGAAILVEPRSPSALAAAIENLLRDSASGARLVAAGASRLADFDWTDSGAALAEAYRCVLIS